MAYSLVLCSTVFKDLKYVINKQSHEFSYNLGIIIPKWPTSMVRSHDTAWGQGPWNRHRKCMESADSAVQKLHLPPLDVA